MIRQQQIQTRHAQRQVVLGLAGNDARDDGRAFGRLAAATPSPCFQVANFGTYFKEINRQDLGQEHNRQS